MGFTTLAWSPDGRHWVRDQTPYFAPDPNETTWDHAHAWMDYQLPLGDEVYIYYGGFKFGHKLDRWEGRQIIRPEPKLRTPECRMATRTTMVSGYSQIKIFDCAFG